MFNFCFKKSLGFVFLLTLSATSLLASPSGTEDEGSRSINSARHIEDLPDEIHLFIFSFLTQKDIPSVTRTSSRWQGLMDDNQLWKEYARRAQIILKEDPFPGRNYKALVRDHCTFSFTDLGFLNGGSESIALGISAEGSVIVGQASDGAAQDQRRAFRWTAEKGMKSLGSLNGGTLSWAQGISADGLVIIGQASDGAAQNQVRAFRWTSERGMESLGTLNGGSESIALGISSDGLVIVGYADEGAAQDQQRAFRWTAEKGMEPLGTLNGGTLSWAQGVSAEGSVIVGEASDGAAQDQLSAFRWTSEKGMKSLGTLNGGIESWAWGISADGSVIVGQASGGAAQGQQSAFRWTSEKGMESVEKMLTDKGLLPPQWRLTKVNAITPTGTVLIGEGKYNDGSTKTLTRAWRAVIPRANLF